MCCCWGIWFWSRQTDLLKSRLVTRWKLPTTGSRISTVISWSVGGNDLVGVNGEMRHGADLLHAALFRSEEKTGGPLRSSVHGFKLQLLNKKQPLTYCGQQPVKIPSVNPSSTHQAHSSKCVTMFGVVLRDPFNRPFIWKAETSLKALIFKALNSQSM